MKDLYSNWMINWMTKKGIPAHKAYDYVGFLGFGSFFLVLFISIIVQNIELSGWLGMVCSILFLLIAFGLLVVSGYCVYQANYMWLMLLLFGPCDVIMGLAIDLVIAWRIVFTAMGILMTGIGIFLAPKQLHNSKKLKPELEAAQKRWESERALRHQKKQPGREQPEPVPESSAPKTQSSEIERLKLRLHVLDTMKSNLKKSGPSADSAERIKYAEVNYTFTAKTLGEKLLEQPTLWVLVCCFQGGQPVYVGTDGRMEIFTDHALAEKGRTVLQEKLNVAMDLRTLSGPDAIRSFFADCAHKGFQVLRLDNGSQFWADLWLKDFFPYREDNLIDGKNRNLRHMFHRAKLYSWLLTGQKDQQSLPGRNLAEMRLTMGLNGYRELGNTLVYALGNAMPEDRLYATPAALDKMREWLPGSGYEESAILSTPVYNMKLQLGFVNRPGEQGNVEKGMVCVFTDLAQAREAQDLFRSSHMDLSVVVVTFEELLSQAVQCAGILVDMQTLGFEIPPSEYAKINEVRKLDAPILVHLKQQESRENTPSRQQESTAPANVRQPKARLRHTEMKNGWKQFDYQWPYRFGYDDILKSAQWLITHDLQLQTLTTAEIAGAPEQEHIQELQACGNLEDCVGKETGVLAVGGASKSTQCLLKVYWYNQTFVVRIFTLGDVEQNRIDAFTEMLLT